MDPELDFLDVGHQRPHSLLGGGGLGDQRPGTANQVFDLAHQRHRPRDDCDGLFGGRGRLAEQSDDIARARDAHRASLRGPHRKISVVDVPHTRLPLKAALTSASSPPRPEVLVLP